MRSIMGICLVVALSFGFAANAGATPPYDSYQSQSGSFSVRAPNFYQNLQILWNVLWFIRFLLRWMPTNLNRCVTPLLLRLASNTYLTITTILVKKS